MCCVYAGADDDYDYDMGGGSKKRQRDAEEDEFYTAATICPQLAVLH